MDNLTHTLYGLTLAKTGLNRVAPRATATLMISAVFPDVDILSFFKGSIGYLQYHRGITHSLVGFPVGALVVATLVYFIHNRGLKKVETAPWWKFFLLALLGTGSHVLLDYTNSYGVQLFLPFSRRWLAGDLVFILDPWIMMLLLVTLVGPFFFSLINQEIGAKKQEHRTAAVLCLLLISAYWVAKAVSHHEALTELAQRDEMGEAPIRVAAVPQPMNPFRWDGIIETETHYRLTEAGWNPFGSEISPLKNRLYPKSEEVHIVQAASQGPVARVFLGFSRFPVFTVYPSAEGHVVTVNDLRFASWSRQQKRFQLAVELNQQAQVLSEVFRF